MAENDLQVKLDRGKEFLTEGHKLRVTVRFVGRQLGHKEFGPQMMARAVSALSDISQIDQDGKWIGRQFTATLSPVKK